MQHHKIYAVDNVIVYHILRLSHCLLTSSIFVQAVEAGAV